MASLALPLLALPVRAGADKPAPPPEKRVVAGTCVTDTGSLLRREAPGKPWQIVKENEKVYTGDLLLGGHDGAVDSLNGAVRAIIVGDVDGRSPLPVIETAFVLHEAKDVDLDLSLERGRIRLINLKTEGAAKVRIRVHDRGGEVTLTEPGATLSVEIYGRWPRGVPFRKEPKEGEAPAVLFNLLAINGQMDLKSPRWQLKLKAPPGHALVEGDTLDDREPAVVFLKELPPWAPERLADLGTSESGKKLLATRARFRQLALEKGISAATDEMLHSDDIAARHFAILVLVATDDLERLGDVLKTTTHQDVWETAIVALRNWIGRGPGQDQKLYHGLIEKAKVPPREAESILELLHSFGDEELTHPAVYQALINYLGSDRTSLRELAYWHLQRLVPAGRKIGYDPLASKEKRDAAIKAWHKLVPPGELPPRSSGE
jgi:hypothetical protein